MDIDPRYEGQNSLFQVPSSLEELPNEILEISRLQKSPQFLQVLATAALKPKLTLELFIRFPTVFTDTCAKWISNCKAGKQNNEIIEAFARILPLAPHLVTYLDKYLENTSTTNGSALDNQCIHSLWTGDEPGAESSGLQTSKILLATFRLLNLDRHKFSRKISGTSIQLLLRNGERAVQYLAVRVFCQLLSASDLKLEAMINEYVGHDVVMGDFDGDGVDYGFLSLFEEKRLQNAHKLMSKFQQDNPVLPLHPKALSSMVVRYGRVLLPRPNGAPSKPSPLVQTATTARNMECFAKSLLSSSPILLHGLAGSGKTSLATDFARELGMESTMVSLHLNEQTDAKMLIGMYTTGSTPGLFTWRPGVLTTAVREGRWVFIEDLDRAPNEVISVILPLIERGELLIPSRGEAIMAGPGFRLLASIRTSLSVSGQENPPALHMLGARLWQRVPVQMPTQDEFREIIAGSYPILNRFLPGIISVYEKLYMLSQKPAFASRSRTSLGRPISPRDLLKWCRRLDKILSEAGLKTGDEPITESIKYDMFLEASDCFAGSLQTEDARKTVVFGIAEEMHIDPQRVEHFLTAHAPRYEDTESYLNIGRARLSKRPTTRAKSSSRPRPFAKTAHAKRLLEQVGAALKMAEPVLLVGETGIGKTTVVQQLADSLGFKLTAVNLSQQSEVGDLLGGFKPVNVRTLAIPLKDEFDQLFAATGISVSKNQKYIDQLGKSVAKSQWSKASKFWHEAPKMFDKILSALQKKELDTRLAAEQPTKRRKTESRLESLLHLKHRWERFSENLDQFDVQLSGGSRGFAFTFVEGNIVKAARNGDWVLLDEINLASPDTLESIADLLRGGPNDTPSILLSETGEIERVQAHPNFRIFGAMNPATDVGKRDLPMGLRSRFTEIYVESPDRDLDDLLSLITAYLRGTSTTDTRAAHDVARLYLNTKRLAGEKRLVDGANQVPHFSLRTLTRVLTYVNDIAPSYGLRRALYEGFAMGFLTLLNRESEKLLVPLINHHLLDTHGNPQSLLAQTPRHPEDGRQYVRFMNTKKDRQYWMLQGLEIPQEQPHYIITPFVERNLLNLVRATSTRRFPVLVQGPTSSGKTSMIEYLAKFSGNKFVRINNHEHTDLQEYLGTYISGSDGKLRFQEGLLVQALRQGHWIVLDELNLAPTDVLEALNRLLDDNRELLIPETQEVVRPHENFMLFATQNPPGLYGGRKTLSRAFRNRFLELHFDDIPEDELEFILEKRSLKVAPSDCRRIVTVYKELSMLRQSNRLFEQKDSFATLRDLFRWALRDADNREQLAVNGYMLLAERVRNPDESTAVKEIIEKVMKVKLDPNILYGADQSPEIKAYNSTSNAQGVVWTQAMRRLYVLVAHALRNNEPVLLVGETGCGKTTACQMLADALGKELHIVNAHQNTETGDLIGAQRPVRNRAAIVEQLKHDLIQSLNILGNDAGVSDDIDVLLRTFGSLSGPERSQVPDDLRQRIGINLTKSKALFEWSDGSLVQAMKDGQFFLLDEISLADDSVLERLNSVLETQRTILLAEKGVENSFIQAADGFQFFATMNPGGDYGKRELSPALRNRFTEIWVPSLSEHKDVLQIVEAKLQGPLKTYADAIVYFAEWFGQCYRSSSLASISVRDVLAWVNFMNSHPSTDPNSAVLHGAAMVYIDTIGANPAALLAINPESIQLERARCLQQLSNLLHQDISILYYRPVSLVNAGDSLSIGDFSICKRAGSDTERGFAFDAPTTKLNAMRVLRALQVQKPILIEGSPGVGKTTLISALARTCNLPLTRINLSEQTDLMDLFGSDVPMEGAEAGHFAWRDAPFLQAMQRGEWVLLDEMNLASQSVLEGLNACLDHRGEVYVSELDRTFKRHPGFTVFAAQNPHHQGGGRKGLPGSFVNRFTVVYADVFKDEDIQLICRHSFPTAPDEILSNIPTFVSQVEQEVVHSRRFGTQGGPWEFNLRDVLRWLQLISSSAPLIGAAAPSYFFNLIFRQRFRSVKDRLEIDRIFATVFGANTTSHHLFYNTSATAYQVGIAYMKRDSLMQRTRFPDFNLANRLSEVESVMICIQQNLPCILVGSSGSGKTTLIQYIAAASGKALTVFPLNADIDTMDLVGGFEQVDPQRSASTFLLQLTDFLNNRVLESLPGDIPEDAIIVLGLLKDPHASTPSYFSNLGAHLRALEAKTSLVEFANLANICQKFANSSMTAENARFEWVDGVLVKALEQGDWLVLDNSNLCSSSVLDRLNSLLEPQGFLSINEHCEPDGQPKIIRPHPEFRIFLTMDPRFGELSRAMRNRAIEIFLEPLPAEPHSHILISRPEACLQRYQTISRVLESGDRTSNEATWLYQVALDNLAWADLAMLSRFTEANRSRSLADPKFLGTCQIYLQLYHSTGKKNVTEAIGNMLDKLAPKTSLAPDFRDAQIIHPLQNSPLVPLLEQAGGPTQAHWLAACLEFTIEIANAANAQKGQASGIESYKPSTMNRLQRSLVRGRVAAIAKDSTVTIDEFLTALLVQLKDFIHSHLHSDRPWKIYKKVVSSILRYWWDTYHLATSTAFEEATFQAHLAIGKDLLNGFSDNTALQIGHEALILGILESLRTHFSASFQLTTGLSMEVLWKYLRPAVISNFQVMETLSQMQILAQRFDALKWKSSVSIPELGGIMQSLIKAYHLVLTSDVDGWALIQSLSAELEKLETSIGKEEAGISPFFASLFESLRQSNTLEMLRSGLSRDFSVDVDTVVLSNHPTTYQMHFATSTKSSFLLQSVDDLLGYAGNLDAVLGIYPVSLLQKLHDIESVDLKSLKLLESELPALSSSLAKSTTTLCRTHLVDLNEVLSRLVLEVISAHGENFAREYETWTNAVAGSIDIESLTLENIDETIARQQRSTIMPVTMPLHLQEVILNNFVGVSVAVVAARNHIQHSLEFSAMAWVQFAIGCITLYVPNRQFDPDKRQRLERKWHQENRDILEGKLSALRKFELLFTGQDSNVRIQLLEAEIKELGDPPSILQEIYRPQDSELDQLQGEFNNVLKTTTQSNISATLLAYFQTRDENNVQEIRLAQNNVTQIIRRLSERFRAYSDITAPIISMLRSMQIGLSFAALASVRSSPNSEVSVALGRMTPFLGGGPVFIENNIISDRPMEYLALATASATTEGLTSFDPKDRESLCSAFHGCYDQWTRRLESDRLEADSKSGLYRFKGSAEDEDEEDTAQFKELFPTYDEESVGERSVNITSTAVRDTAVSISRVHARIFLGGITPSESILSLIRHMSSQIAILHDNTPFGAHDLTAAFLPGSMLLLNDRIGALATTTTIPGSYNFYTDANLPETRKLVTLIYQIQNRFLELQAVDEIGHMQPLGDVLLSCRELLEFRHTEPLAKIITKVEKVHTFMHEWQFGGWASRANAALTLYDDLTSTIVSWRRLELSTWANLFDMESQKCEDDARSWWFVAYQVVVAVPLRDSENPHELKNYAQKLLQDLETYFATAMIGQFVQRLQLLKQLRQHLQLLMHDFPSMSIIHGALSNFISLYARYEKPVFEGLKSGRSSLEKSMRDVLLLASWKDTNIVALRDSAKRSHHKLFKIVRKFRALLGQPMEFIIKQGIPEESGAEVQNLDHLTPVLKPIVDQTALALCMEYVPGWSQKSKRFVNVSTTVDMMVSACQTPESAVDGPSYLDSVLGSIISSTAELQKATPLVMTEDTKDIVKHLKSRKRKLFADTLKALRQMGIKHNLSADALTKQDSLSASLVNLEASIMSSNTSIHGLEYYFHKSIDLAPRVREVARQPSKDLSSAEVTRSVGFLEGALQLLLAQHSVISANAMAMSKFEALVAMASGMWAPNRYEVHIPDRTSNHEKVLRWLPHILNVAIDLVTIHYQMSKIDSRHSQDLLASWKCRFEELLRNLDSLPPLPLGTVSDQRVELEDAITVTTQELRFDLARLISERPDLAFILNQVVPWSEVVSSRSTPRSSGKTISDLDHKLSDTCDAILVGIEKYKATINSLPTSIEDAAWLIGNDSSLSTSIKSLHCEIIISHVDQSFGILRQLDLDNPSTRKAVSAIFAVALPIFQQYSSILKHGLKEYEKLHRATCKMSYVLSKTFIQIATQGFCTPSEKSNGEDGKSEKLEGGTGLGEGEGAEDISKDIQDDENLDELAQEPNVGEKEEIKDEQDAVDMADADMAGEMGEGKEQGSEEGDSEDEGESGDDMDEEAGDVDNLDPTAVDEKMWDGDGEEAEKDQAADDSKGKKSKDETIAAQDNNKQAAEGDEGEPEEEVAGEEQGEEIKQDETEKHDPHAQEGEALDLPDDMELDGDKDGESEHQSEDGMDDLSDIEPGENNDEVSNNGQEEPGAENMDGQEDQETSQDMDVVDVDEEPVDEGERTEEAGDKAEDESQQQDEDEGLLRDSNDDANLDPDNAAPSDVQGTGEAQEDISTESKTEPASKAQREDGGRGGDSSEQRDAAAEDGEQARQANGEAPQDPQDSTEDTSSAQPFKKLGDALERWHRQQTKIREPAGQKEQAPDQQADINTQSFEFQHMQDEDAEADTQALGTATDEQAHALDESMAVDSESKDMPDQFQPEEAEKSDMEDNGAMDIEEPSALEGQNISDAYDGRAGAMIKQAQDESNENVDDQASQPRKELEDVEGVDNQLESTHLDETSILQTRSSADARQQWTHYESLTRNLSLSLTEQLRLILAPTLATKMRGDFRTGKRLNIKRIIPYIASQYKRDKIWMRRSVPSKRSYQIMLAVDDSKSMGESGSGSLALETLVMVSKSLSMLEVGEICVVGFGDQVKVAHGFETPFSSDAGPNILRDFSFDQSRTDVTRLVRDSIELFRTARAKTSSSPADLWQVELIISDGVCDSSEHEPIRRLLREALEERIMIVFVIVDDVRTKKKGESVMDLKEAKFVKDENTGVSNVKIERYLDTFPFQYYLVVSDVKELPGVLATLLRQWFAEVADSSS